MLLTGNRLPPTIKQPPLNERTVSNSTTLLKHLKAQQQTTDTVMATVAAQVNGLSGVGLLADRPPVGGAGRFFYATDVSHLYIDNGHTWVQLV